MRIQKLHETFVPTLELNKAGDIMHNVKRIRPHIALRPPLIWPGPIPVGVSGFHKPRGRVEDGSVGLRAGEELLSKSCVGGSGVLTDDVGSEVVIFC